MRQPDAKVFDGASDPVLESLDAANQADNDAPAYAAGKNEGKFQCGATAHGIRWDLKKGN
jgi:hypothetical protein